MRRMSVIVSTLSLAGSLAAAQRQTTVEVGTLVGVTILSQSGNSVTHVGIPGDGIQASPTLYASFFLSPSLFLEPQLAFTSISSNGSHLTSIGFAAQLGYLFAPNASGSGYVAANAAIQSISDGGSISGEGVGAALGYRFKVKNSLALRVDGRYRRWFGDFKDMNEVGIGLGLGATF